jgi:hypothetical protein
MPRRRRSEPTNNPSATERVLERYHYEFLKSLLYRLHRETVCIDGIRVMRMMGVLDVMSYRAKPVSVSDDVDGAFTRVLDVRVSSTVEYHGRAYDVVTFSESTPMDSIIYPCFVHGIDAEASEPKALLDLLLSQSIAQSPLANQAIEISSEGQIDPTNPVSVLKLVPTGGDELAGVYLPDRIRKDVDYFIRALRGYGRLQKPLRYLLSGNPGTAKTKLIRAIAGSCRGEATFVMTTGSDRRVDAIFDFASHFKPCVLCIDDVDLMAGSRDERLNTSLLATFLQKLDGFTASGLFVLATTNDKNLVDYAASRPGRFDAVIDVGAIEPRQYLDLIQSKTAHAEIRGLFDAEILKLLADKAVTGAFIANLVKHLELVREFEPEQLTGEYVAERIATAYNGFYKNPAGYSKVVGF